MDRRELLSEQKSSGRWLLAGSLLLLSIPLLGGPLLLLSTDIHGLVVGVFGPSTGSIMIVGAMLLAVAVFAAAVWCLIVAAVLYVSSESGRG
jgi:hypothetical protein